MRTGAQFLLGVLVVFLLQPAFSPGEGQVRTVDCATAVEIPRDTAPPLPTPDDPSPLRRWAGSAIVVVPEGEGCAVTRPEDGVRFDLDGDGTPEQVSWTPEGSGLSFLAIDRDGDGRITSGRELVGRQTVAGHTNGIAALESMAIARGSAPAASVSVGDPLFASLLLWTDRNHNGRSEPSELRPFGSRYSDVGLGYEVRHIQDRFGNWYRYSGWVRVRPQPGAAAPPGSRADQLRYRVAFEIYFAKPD